MCLVWKPKELLFGRNHKKGLMFINDIMGFGRVPEK